MREVLRFCPTQSGQCVDESLRDTLPPILFKNPNHFDRSAGVSLDLSDWVGTPGIVSVRPESVESGPVPTFSFSAHE